VADGRADEPPQAVAEKPDRDQAEQDLAERAARDGLQRTLLVGRLAARAEGDLDGQDADEDVDHAAGDEPGTGQPFELLAARDVLSGRLGVASRVAALGFRTSQEPARCRPTCHGV
jgi:hypothetical protein